MYGIILATSRVEDMWRYILPNIEDIDFPDKEVRSSLLNDWLDEVSCIVNRYMDNNNVFNIQEEYETYLSYPWVEEGISLENFEAIIRSFIEEVYKLLKLTNSSVQDYTIKLQSCNSYSLVLRNFESLVYYSDMRGLL